MFSTLRKFLAPTAMMALAFGAVCLPAQAFAKNGDIPQAEIEKFKKENQDTKIQALPMGRVMVSEKNGISTIVSDNGRYRFNGSITDTWAKIEINNYQDAKYSATHLPMENLKLDSNILDPLVYGDKPKQNVLVFLSPDDKGSRHLLSEMPGLSNDFQFEIVVVPASSTPSRMAAAFSCVDDEKHALDALLSGEGLTELRPAKGCDLQMLSNRMIAFNLLGFYDLPAVVAPSTTISNGDRDDGWEHFLQENMK